jgi:hypothetical protein
MTTSDPGDIPDSLKREPSKEEYGFHPLCELFPLIADEDLDALAADIKANGLLEPITLKDGTILDGRNRYLACRKAGHTLTARDFVKLKAETDPLMFVISKNIQRRHLSADQKRAIIALLLERQPDASSRQIASIAHVSHHTVEDVRESTGQSAQLRTGADGKSRRTPGKRGKRGGAPTVQELRKQIDDFKAEWLYLNDWQKTFFVKSYMDELEKLIDDIKALAGVVIEEEADQQKNGEEEEEAEAQLA